MIRFFEDMVIGETVELGGHTFTADEIIEFATAYDPQRFHLSEEGAADSHFGRLCASGWHTAAVWMKKFVETRDRLVAEMAARGEPIPRLGPSPGYRDLVWKKPVYVGDTIRFSSTLIEKRESQSRPQWGIVSHRNEGFNQNGDLVYGFTGSVFVERRG